MGRFLRIPGPDRDHRFILAQARQSRFQLPETGLEILDTAHSVQHQYASLDPDLADAVNVALAAQYWTNAILTLDQRGFAAMRPSPPQVIPAPSRRPIANLRAQRDER